VFGAIDTIPRII
jgi:hypothetical protein